MKDNPRPTGHTTGPSRNPSDAEGPGWRAAFQVWLGGAVVYAAVHLGFWWMAGASLSYAPFLIPPSLHGVLPEPSFIAFFGLESILVGLVLHGLLRALTRGERRVNYLYAHRLGFLVWIILFIIFNTRAQPYLIDKAPSNFFLLGYSIILPISILIGAFLISLSMRLSDERKNNLVFGLVIVGLAGLSILAIHYRLRVFWDLAYLAKTSAVLLACLSVIAVLGLLALGRAQGWPGPRLRALGNWGLGVAAALSVAGVVYGVAYVGPKTEETRAALNLEENRQYIETVERTEKGLAYFTVGPETREALLVTPQRESTLTVKVDQPLSLRVGFGARMEGPGEGRVAFELSARAGEEESLLVSEKVRVTDKAGDWSDRVVDLTPWAGKEVSLRFRIRPLSDDELLSAAWSAPYPTSPPTEAASRPHVIIISLDTLRADHLSSYGYRRLTSPNVDALAKGGVRFARTFSTASYTLPSHMSIMTGRFTTEHLVGTPTSPNNRLDSSIPTLAEILKELGYLTVAVTGGNWVSPEWFKRGFYRFRTSESSMFEHLWDLEENLEAVRRVLESRKSERLFLFFHTYKPHTPYMGRFFLLDEGIKVDPKDLLFPYNNIDVARALYDGDIKETDAYVGLLLKLLEEQGILQDALIVLTSDHGEAFEEHGNRTHGSTLFDEELHVPLIFFYPPRVPAGRTVESITSSVDILPTVLELLEVKPVAGLDGTSLRPLWSGGGASVDRAVFIGEANKGKYASAIAIRTPRYKLIGFAGPHNGTLELDRSRSTLYDLESDPGEKVDRLAELPKVSSRLGKALLEAFRTQEVNIATAVEKSDILEISRERRKQLKALGYLQ